MAEDPSPEDTIPEAMDKLAEQKVDKRMAKFEAALEQAIENNKRLEHLVNEVLIFYDPMDRPPSVDDGPCLVAIPGRGCVIAVKHPKLLGAWIRDNKLAFRIRNGQRYCPLARFAAMKGAPE